MPDTLLDLIHDHDAVDLVMQMMAIPGKSGLERQISDFIVARLRESGVPESAIMFDTAHKRSPLGGEVGNLIVKLPGTTRGPRRLLMGHTDTVPLCVGCQPVRKGDVIASRDPATALGGDNRGGAAVVLTAATTILKHKLPHPPLTLFFPVQEEVGLIGARYVSVPKLGRPKLCFNWDGGLPSVAVIGATGADHLDIEIDGLASHAGAHPEDGISAITIAGKAIADLADNGWHGLVCKGRKLGTSNIGYVHGGEATNVVTNQVTLHAEARSHDPQFRRRIVAEFVKAFERAAKGVKNAAGECGRARVTASDKYESFRLPEGEPCVAAALAAIERVGLAAETRISNGGLDANWLTAHGLPTVTLGCGQQGIHTVNETLDVECYLQACRTGLVLATAAEG